MSDEVDTQRDGVVPVLVQQIVDSILAPDQSTILGDWALTFELVAPDGKDLVVVLTRAGQPDEDTLDLLGEGGFHVAMKYERQEEE